MPLKDVTFKKVNAQRGFLTDKHDEFLSNQCDYELGILAHDNFSSKSYRINELGRGIESIVFTKNNDQWISTVRKWLRHQPLNPSTCLPIKYLISSQHTTFSPKIYRIKQVQKTQDTCDYLIDMEKLVHINDLNEQQRIQAMLSIFDQTIDNDELVSETQFFRLLYVAIANVHDSMVLNNKLVTFKPQFIKCCKAIKKVCGSNRDLLDLHSDNIMGRITHLGVQLVISDPIYKR